MELTPEVELSFRQYLLGHKPYPSDIIIGVEVSTKHSFQMMPPERLVLRKPEEGRPANVGVFFHVFGVTMSLFHDPVRTGLATNPLA